MKSALRITCSAFALCAAFVYSAALVQAAAPPVVAATPPMGWNSWDCYGTTVEEAEVKANADYMAAHLKQHGWEYIVVDIQWSQPAAKGFDYQPDANLSMDAYGRLIPAVNRFPSSADGKGFKPLADYVHGLGLKFGIHIMRGIPRRAVKANLPVFGSRAHAADFADAYSLCPWNPDMYGVETSKPGGQVTTTRSSSCTPIGASISSRPTTSHARRTAARSWPCTRRFSRPAGPSHSASRRVPRW